MRWCAWAQGVSAAGLVVALFLVASAQTAEGSRDVVSRYGPGGSPVSVVAVDPTDSETFYVGTSDGAYKSTDGGGSWATSLVGTEIFVTALAIDPITPSTLYAGTPSSGIWKSTDAGGTWSVNFSLWGAHGLVIDPHIPSTLYGWNQFYCENNQCSGGTFFKSTDGGRSWKVLPHLPPRPDDPSISALAIDPGRPATLYAVGTVTTGCRFPWDSCSIDSSVYRSTDGGVGWHVGARFGGYFPAFSLAIDPRTPATLYVGVSGGGEGTDGNGVFKSTDGGASWRTAGLTDSGVLSLAIDPARSDALYANTGGGVFKTTDGASTWNDTPLRTTGFIATVALAPSMPDTLYAATGDGVSKSTDGGGSWNRKPGVVLSTPRVLAIEHDGLYVVTEDGAVFRISPTGNAWTASLLGTNATTVAIDPTTPGTAYAGVGGTGPGAGGVLRTIDGGRTWGTAGLSETGIFALIIDPTTPSTLYAGTTGGVFKSTDGGDTWGILNHVAGDSAVLALAIGRDPLGTLYAGTSSGDAVDDVGVFKSTDGGHTWSRSGLTNTIVRALTIDLTTPGTLYASSHDDGLFKSTDGGATWCDAGMPHVSTLVIDRTRPGRLYAVSDSGLFKSTNGGNTWNPTDPGDAIALAIDPATPDTLYVGTRDRGLFVVREVSTCIGDCGNSNAVTVDNLLTLVNIALGNTVLAGCLAGDRNQDGTISVDEIVVAVSNALHACPDSPDASVIVAAASTSALADTVMATPTQTPAPFPTERPIPTERPRPRLTPCAALP